jgi:hypothetical protein
MRQVQEEFYDETKCAAAAKRDTAKMELYDSNKENVSSTHDDSLHHQLTHGWRFETRSKRALPAEESVTICGCT